MEKNNKNIRVTQKAIVFRKDGKFLTLRRSNTAPSRPLHWDLPGGDLEYGEDVKEGIIREIKEESDLEVENLKVLDIMSGIYEKDDYWVTIGYTAHSLTKEVKLSYEHDKYCWVTSEDFRKLKTSEKYIKLTEKI